MEAAAVRVGRQPHPDVLLHLREHLRHTGSRLHLLQAVRGHPTAEVHQTVQAVQDTPGAHPAAETVRPITAEAVLQATAGAALRTTAGVVHQATAEDLQEVRQATAEVHQVAPPATAEDLQEVTEDRHKDIRP